MGNALEYVGMPGPRVTNQSPTPGTQIKSSVDIDVTFSTTVFGVDASDLVLSGTPATGAIVGTPIDLGGNTWRFPVINMPDGFLFIYLAPDENDIQDALAHDLFPAPTSWYYFVDETRASHWRGYR
jgi:hypothetical protein